MDDETRAWFEAECKKTMPWTALELHYDFCLTDNFSNLKKITVPYAVFGAQSKAYGLDMVDRFAAEVRGYSEVHKFYKSGHLMFLYERKSSTPVSLTLCGKPTRSSAKNKNTTRKRRKKQCCSRSQVSS